MIDGGIGFDHSAERLAGMTRLTAGGLARRFTQAAGARRLFFNPSLEGRLLLLRLCSRSSRSSSATRAKRAAF
jgi:hypothetical protein